MAVFNERIQFLVLLLPVLILPAPANAGLARDTDPETGLVRWSFTAENLEIELIQRLPDQTRGFFLARGFPAAVSDEIATSCIFQTIVRNTSQSGKGQVVVIDLGDWRMIRDGLRSGIKLKEPWMASWPDETVSPASRLAFRWATFPTRQEFLSGDYNWGMTAFGLAPGMVFDLEVSWLAGVEQRSARLHDLQCAADVDRLL